MFVCKISKQKRAGLMGKQWLAKTKTKRERCQGKNQRNQSIGYIFFFLFTNYLELHKMYTQTNLFLQKVFL